ncbi:amidase, partial [Aphelenchoides avenae]
MGLFKQLYPLLRLAFRVYFWAANLVFWAWNFGKTRRSVDKPDNALLMISAMEAADMVRTGELTSSELVEAYIERITHVNPLINAVVNVNFDEAREAAQQVDKFMERIAQDPEEIQKLAQRKPLFGVPVSLKENISLEGFTSTVGLVCRKDAPPAETDAVVVQNLREAGAIPLVTTNLPELGMWWESFNNLWGRTNNPYDTRRTCGGSSGGEGALIGAAASVIGVGGDIGGSIRIPAFFTGIF